MIIGVPKEIKADEYRVALLPVGAELLTKDSHKILVERGTDDFAAVSAGHKAAINMQGRKITHHAVSEAFPDLLR